MSESRSVEARFARLVAALADTPGVSLGGAGRGFGSGALQVNGRIFAMLSADRLVLKLPRDRVAGLLASGDGLAFDAGKGRPMKEWIALRDPTDDQLLELANEARVFVASTAR